MRNATARELIAIISLVLVAIGVGQIHIPSAFIVIGILGLIGAIWGHFNALE